MLGFLTLFMGCSSTTNNYNLNNKSTIVTTFYPVEEITKNIVGNNFNVEVLIPLGIDPHSFEPRVKSIVELSKAGYFVTMGGMFAPIENKIIDANPSIKVIDSTKNINLLMKKNEEDVELKEFNKGVIDKSNYKLVLNNNLSDFSDFDPHIWLSIDNMIIMTNNIKDSLIIQFPQYTQEFEKNADNYIKSLNKLKLDFDNGLDSCNLNKVLVNHKAFGYLGYDYGFSQISVSGFTSESEPSPSTIKDVIDTAKKDNIKYVFVEDQLDSKVTKTIASDIGGEIFTLDVIKMNSSQSYTSLMEDNLKNLRIALDCN